MGDASSLFTWLLLGLIGMAYLVYARKERDVCFLVCGLGLTIEPMFVNQLWLVLILGAALAAAPFLIRHYGRGL